MKRKHLIVFLCLIGPAGALSAADAILLKNGVRVNGTILAQSRDQVIMQVGEGQAVYAKRAIRRIYDNIIDQPPVTTVMPDGQFPPWWVPLADLYGEDWVTEVENIPATRIESGLLENVPYLSFRANSTYEMNIYGDPAKPAAVEIGYYGKRTPKPAVVQHCREFMVSYLTTLSQIKTLYSLDKRGGSQMVDGLTLQITPPDAPDAYNGWWILAYNPTAIAAVREPTVEAFEAKSTANLATVLKSTDGATTWRKWQVTDALERLIPMERNEER